MSVAAASPVRTFIEHHFLHFNARETVAAAKCWEAHLARDGKVLVTLAGAMSTARIGRILSRAIRAGKVHAICCTGANLEEDVMALLTAKEYEIVADWRALRAEDEQALYERGMNRVTDTLIPETVMRHLEHRLIERWSAAASEGRRQLPADFLFEVLGDPDLAANYQADASDSWMLAAKEMGIPVITPGWEDSTTGNMFAAAVWRGDLPDHACVVSGTEQMTKLMRWYLEHHGVAQGKPGIGFFQVGGGIAGDFPICAVPAMVQDLQMTDVPKWAWFTQISDAVTSYGGYSGAVPNEKITWGKLSPHSPGFMIQSDATIVFPLILAWLLGD